MVATVRWSRLLRAVVIATLEGEEVTLVVTGHSRDAPPGGVVYTETKVCLGEATTHRALIESPMEAAFAKAAVPGV